MRGLRFALLVFVLIAGTARAAQPTESPRLLGDVLPLFKTRCVKCHGPATSEGGLNLGTPGTIARGGDSGAAIVPAQREASLLWQRVAADEMPPEEPLSADEKATLARWISSGAAGLPAEASDHPSGDHWAFLPLAEVAAPAVRDAARVRTPLDRFVLAPLEARGLSFRTEADRQTLIRRVAFGLTGLPPTPQEILAFVGDDSPAAYRRMVDRYLASPHYGERWGKFWLDAAGYADSNGYFNADSDRPLAYRYRDYVVRSINADLPFDRFVVEQLAGDELAGFVPDQDVTDETISLLEATHFLRNGQDGTGESDGNPDEVKNDRYAALEASMQIVASSLLGLTIGCAKCHDHKFEPISQRDYFNLQSVFYPAFNVEDWVKPNDRFVHASPPNEREAWERHEQGIDARIAALRAELADWVRGSFPPPEVLLRGAFVGNGFALANLRGDVADDGERLPKKPLGGQWQARREKLAEDVEQLEARRAPRPGKIAVVSDRSATPPEVFLLERGNHQTPGETVAPAPLAALAESDEPLDIREPFDGAASTGRRLAWARWVTRHDARPAALMARVQVNRVWQQHFGTGLVATSENLGASGSPPTHPELLEYLAGEFVRGGWSLKQLHRLILNSAVYRQASTLDPEAFEIDPDNRLLWRMPVRRLDAEAVRDAMLAIGGRLDRRFGGPYVPTTRDELGEVVVGDDAPGATRRSLYLQQRRTQTLSLLDVFDSPRMVFNCVQRPVSTIPLQSLSLLNSPFAVDAARHFAARLLAEPEGRIERGFLLALGRAPDEAERQSALEFIATQREHYVDQEDAEAKTWADFCQMLLASSAFLYVE